MAVEAIREEMQKRYWHLSQENLELKRKLEDCRKELKKIKGEG